MMLPVGGASGGQKSVWHVFHEFLAKEYRLAIVSSILKTGF